MVSLELTELTAIKGRRDKNGEGVLSSFNSSQSKVYMILALSRKANDLNNRSEK